MNKDIDEKTGYHIESLKTRLGFVIAAIVFTLYIVIRIIIKMLT